MLGTCAFAHCGGPSPNKSLIGNPSKVITLPVMVICGPFLKTTTRISFGGATYGWGPQLLCKTTAESFTLFSAETSALAASKTLSGAVGESHRTMLVAWNPSSDLEEADPVSRLHLASLSKMTIQLTTLVRSGSDRSETKVYCCPVNFFNGVTKWGINARSGVRQDMLSASLMRANRSSSAVFLRSLCFLADYCH